MSAENQQIQVGVKKRKLESVHHIPDKTLSTLKVPEFVKCCRNACPRILDDKKLQTFRRSTRSSKKFFYLFI